MQRDQVLKIGPHRLTNASIEESIIDDMLHGEVVDVLYTDPPWDNMKYWVTMNRKMTGAEFVPLSYDHLLDRVFDLGRQYVNGYICVEAGHRGTDAVLRRFADNDLHGVRSFTTQHAWGSARLIIGGTSQEFGLKGKLTSINGVLWSGREQASKGASISRLTVASLGVRGGLVLDPCCGMGYTARAAVAAGMRFAGNEFNAKRLQKTTDFLRKSENHGR